jgi:G6PDH family F420-dependent oxidoreductase
MCGLQPACGWQGSRRPSSSSACYTKVMRVSFHGEYYEVHDARIYTLPDEPVPIYVSGFGPQATRLAGRIGDGYSTAMPDADLVRVFRESGDPKRPVQGGMKVCWAQIEQASIETAHRLWANELLPGQLGQMLPRPKDFEAVNSLVTSDAVAQHFPCGPDPQRHVAAVQPYLDAGFDEVYVQQIGSHHEEFFRVWADEVLPGASLRPWLSPVRHGESMKRR